MGTRFHKLMRFPRNRLIEDELVRCRASELDLLSRFGDPTSETGADEMDPTFYWDLEWACGLVMGLQFKQLNEVLSVRLDAPDVDHALRHLGFAVTDVWQLETAAPDRFHQLAGRSDRSWELWQQGGERLASGLTERDAACRCAELSRPDAPPCSIVRAA